MKAILSICLNPTLQKTLIFPGLIPDTVNRAAEHRLDASGKGINVSRVLTQLGKKVIHLTQLGGSFRPALLELCVADKITVEWVESYSPVRFCYTIINNENKTATELVEEGERVEEHTGERLLEALGRLLPDVSSMVVSGSKAAGFSDSLFDEMVRMAKAQSIRVVLDIRGKDLVECLQWKPDFIKINLFEFASTFAPDLCLKSEKSEEDPELKPALLKIANDLYTQHGTQSILTRGSKDVWYFENGEFMEHRIERCEPLSAIGSGDAFAAGFASALEDGLTLKEAVAEGARCGKLNALLLRPGVIR